MRKVVFLLSLCFYSVAWIVAFASCGGDGGDVTPDASIPPLPVGATIQCERDGDVYLCLDDQCFPDSEYTITEVVEPGEEDEEIKFLATPKLDIQGPVTIIAECGSNVVFSLREDNSTVDLSAEGSITP